MPSLISCTPGMERTVFPLGKAILLIGREENAGIQLENDTISKEHASIITINGLYVLRDNGSTNGTFVNEKKVSEKILSHNDIIRFGPYQFQVDLESMESAEDFTNEEISHLDRGGQEYRRSFTLQKSASGPMQVLMAGKVPSEILNIVQLKSEHRTMLSFVVMAVTVIILGFLLYNGHQKRTALENQVQRHLQTIDGLQKDITSARQLAENLQSELAKTKESLRVFSEANKNSSEDFSQSHQQEEASHGSNQTDAGVTSPNENQIKKEDPMPGQESQDEEKPPQQTKGSPDKNTLPKDTSNVGPSSPTQKPVVQTVQAVVPTPRSAATPTFSAPVSDFFKIDSVKFVRKAPKDGMAVWKVPMVKGKPGVPIFRQCLEVKVLVSENTRSDKTFARAYFYGEDDKLITSLQTPSESGVTGKSMYSVPVLYYKDKPNRFFFEVPDKVEGIKWKALFVFGDKNEAQFTTYPAMASASRLDYPEKKIVESRAAKRVARKADMDPLIEHVVHTRNPRMPQITLFLRPPKGISNASEVEGVMAVCVLANGLEDMKRELRKEEMTGDYAGLFSFANEHKLAILAWGSRGLWDPGRNYNELSREKARIIDESFDLVSTAWARGVKELGDKYGIPQKNFLLWGNCGSAQFAARLCLRKPEYFLAVHVHMPGSYDKPTPEAAKVMWCLTIGELEGGYERSKRWVKTVREMGYPIVYKAIPGLGHSGHPDAAALGFEFFRFALLQKSKRESLDEKLEKQSLLLANTTTKQPWIEEFRCPFNYGDIVNQEIFPPVQVEMIPEGFRIALPTKKIAAIWSRNK